MRERRGCTADSQEPFNAVLASAEDSDKPVAFRVLSQCRWASDELLLPLRACIVLDHEKIARSPWRYHDGVRPGRRPERQHPEEHCRWGRETHIKSIECEAGHTRPDARAARATITVPITCPTARAVTSPGQSRIEAIRTSKSQPRTGHTREQTTKHSHNTTLLMRVFFFVPEQPEEHTIHIPYSWWDTPSWLTVPAGLARLTVPAGLAECTEEEKHDRKPSKPR